MSVDAPLEQRQAGRAVWDASAVEKNEWIDGSPRFEVLAPGVERLAVRTPTLPPASATNSLFCFGEQLLVIEPACPSPRETAMLVARIDALIAEGIALAGFAITHHHADHIGAASVLARRYCAPIFAHESTKVRTPTLEVTVIDESWRLELGGGREVCVLHSPGHAPGHLVFVEGQSGVGHAGDLIAGVGTILIDPEDDGDLDLYMASLRRVLAQCEPPGSSRSEYDGAPALAVALQNRRTIRRLVPAHGPVVERPAEQLKALLRHRESRTRAVLAALTDGPLGDAELLACVYAELPQALWPLAQRSLAAHLISLRCSGRIVLRGGRWLAT